MKLTIAVLEKYRDIIDFTSEDRACPLREFHWCQDCMFYDQPYCALNIHDKCNAHLLQAFKQKYPELFI